MRIYWLEIVRVHHFHPPPPISIQSIWGFERAQHQTGKTNQRANKQ